MHDILEVLSQKKAEVGTVKFSTSTLADPLIKKALAHISKETGKPVAELEKKIQAELDKFEKLKKKAPILYHTIALNLVEGETFKALNDVKVKGAPVFDEVTFGRLWRFIRLEHKSMFPMSNFVNHNVVHYPRKIFLPSDDPDPIIQAMNPRPNDPVNKGVDTACATPDGWFAFNVKFMQNLLNWAYLKKIQPKGRKYKNNGGSIPPEYAYIEFLIMHEFMHYTYADFHYEKLYKALPEVSNWTGDFRSNYDLVKTGHEQLPNGLYNDLINLDRQRTWKEMYDLVYSEFKKLDKNEKKNVTEVLGDGVGKHPHPGGKSPVKKQPGQPGGATTKDAEKSAERVRKRADRDEGGATKPSENKPGEGTPDSGKPGSGGKDVAKDIYGKYSPTMSWTELIDKLIRTSTDEDITYRKMHRRSSTTIHAAAQGHPGAIKPGAVEVEANKLKLVIVIDSSGSMTDEIGQIYANIAHLVKEHESELPVGFVLVKFSDQHTIYLCIAGQPGEYKQIKSLTDIEDGNEEMEQGDLGKLFKEHYGGGTTFSSKLVTDLEKYIAEDYNILIVSDTDIIDGRNKVKFNELYKGGKGNVYLIAKNKHCYTEFLRALQEKSSNITHM
jgi:hypothetical protein